MKSKKLCFQNYKTLHKKKYVRYFKLYLFPISSSNKQNNSREFRTIVLIESTYHKWFIWIIQTNIIKHNIHKYVYYFHFGMFIYFPMFSTDQVLILYHCSRTKYSVTTLPTNKNSTFLPTRTRTGYPLLPSHTDRVPSFFFPHTNRVLTSPPPYTRNEYPLLPPPPRTKYPLQLLPSQTDEVTTSPHPPVSIDLKYFLYYGWLTERLTDMYIKIFIW